MSGVKKRMRRVGREAVSGNIHGEGVSKGNYKKGIQDVSQKSKRMTFGRGYMFLNDDGSTSLDIEILKREFKIWDID